MRRSRTVPERGRPGAPGKLLCRFVLVLSLLCSITPVQAASHRRAVLVLLHGVTAESFLQAASGPEWDRLRSASALGVMNAVVPPPATPDSAYLTLGAGRRVRCPAGLLPLKNAVSLQRYALQRNDLPMEAPGAGALVDACHAAHQQVLIISRKDPQDHFDSPGLLAAADQNGDFQLVTPLKRVDDPATVNTLATARFLPDGLLLVDLPYTSAESTLRFTEALARALDPVRDLLILTSADPGPPSQGEWSSLAPVLIWNWGFHGAAITSNTTRTRGLIANVDIAPTLLDHLGVPIPHTMQGHPVRPAGAGSVESALRLNAGLLAAHQAMKPGLIGWGVFAFLAFLAGAAALLSRKRAWQGAARFGLLWAAAFIPAMLLAGIGFSHSAGELVARVAVIALACAGAAWYGRRRVPPVLSIYGLIVLTVLGDLFTGSHLLQRSLLGDYAFTGARFYGIGNEFEGLILGTSILAPLWAVQVFRVGGASSHTPAPPHLHTSTLIPLAVLWLLTLFAVASPGRGADFGGAVSLGLGYAVAAAGIWSLRTSKRLAARHVLLVGLLVLLVVGAMVGADLLRPAGSRSHVGELAARTLTEGWGPVGEIAWRKVRLNLSMVLSPYCLVSLAGVLPVLLIGYHKLDPGARGILARRPLLRMGVIATLIGAVAGLLANDSGIVAWAFATGCALLLCLDLMLEDSPASEPAAAMPGSETT